MQKAYESGDSTLLFWQMLARFGVVLRMIELVCHFPTGIMRGSVPKDSGRCPKWFEVAQELLFKGCVLSSLLFNVFFAAILFFSRERLKENMDIHSQIWPTHLQETPSKVGSETALECTQRTIWGMLYVCMYGHTHIVRVWINQIRLRILLVVS